jgi:RNA polymerase sigma-70 factor, ECF subfamily
MDVNEYATDVLARDRLSDDGPEALLERHGDSLYRVVLRITGIEEDAAKALEDTILEAARTTHPLGREPVIGSWIYKTAARVAYERLRARRPAVHEIALDDVLPTLDHDGRHFESTDDWSNQIHERALSGALRTILTEAIDALPADYKTALVLHDIEGASKPDIAEILGIDVPGVNARVHRARLFVRKRLSEYFESDAA